MDRQAFEAALVADGYECETVSREAGLARPEHHHPFDTRALVLDGSITLESEGGQRTYAAGEVFFMAAGCTHREIMGPEGVSLLVGRRKRARARRAAG